MTSSLVKLIEENSINDNSIIVQGRPEFRNEILAKITQIQKNSLGLRFLEEIKNFNGKRIYIVEGRKNATEIFPDRIEIRINIEEKKRVHVFFSEKKGKNEFKKVGIKTALLHELGHAYNALNGTRKRNCEQPAEFRGFPNLEEQLVISGQTKNNRQAFLYCENRFNSKKGPRVNHYGFAEKEMPNDPRQKNSTNGKTSLHYAAFTDADWNLEQDLNNGGDPNALDNEGRTPLHYAAAISDSCTKLLITSTADINIKDHKGNTPLHYAAGISYLRTQLLINGGADINAKDHNGDTPLMIATAHQGVRIVKELLKHGAQHVCNAADEYPLFIAVKKNNIDLVQVFIESGVSIDLTDLTGQNALHKAQTPEMMRFLIKNGVNVNQQCHIFCETPLHVAVMNGNLDLVKVLVEEGSAAIDIENRSKETPMNVAAMLGDKEIVSYLTSQHDKSNTK